MSTANPTPTQSVEFLNKRKMMTFIPVLGVPFLTVMFWLGGGGTAVPDATAESTNATLAGGGINTALPSAQPAPLFDSKADAYKAPMDTTSHNGLNFSSTLPDTVGTASGLNYGVQTGDNRLGFEQQADPNVVAVQSRLQSLQQARNLPPSYGPAPGGYAPAPGAYGPSGAYGGGGGYAPAPAAYGPSGGGYGQAASPREAEYDMAMKDIDRLKNEYERRLTELQKPAAPAAPTAPTPAGAATNQSTATVVSSVPTNVVTTLAASKGKAVVAPSTTSSNSFHSVGVTELAAEVNAVPAAIHSDQTVVSGSTVKMRLLQDVLLEGRLIPRNTIVYGVCSLSGQRLEIEIASVQYQNSILPVKLTAYDLDGSPGLYVPGSMSRDATKQGVSQGISSADMLTMSPSLGAQAAGVAMQTGKALLGKQVKLVKVNLKANYKILLK